MKNTIKLIKSLISPYLVALAMAALCHSTLACDGTRSSESTVPEILRYSVKGIAEFATIESELCKLYPPERTAYVLDLHGVQSRHSTPSGPAAPRGNMPDYTRYKIASGHPVILASAWNNELKVIEDVRGLGLQDAFKLKGEVEFGVSQFGGSPCKYYKLGNIAALKRLNPPEQPPPAWYFQKAFTPLVIYGPDCSFDMLIFIDDSSVNVDTFLQDVPQTPYFSKLKKLVLFQVPPIKGANLEIDWIAPTTLLPQEFRTLTYRPEGYVNPLAQAEYYSKGHGEEETPVFTLADAPSSYVSPSRQVFTEPELADVGEDPKKSADRVVVPAPTVRLSASSPLGQSGIHYRADYDKDQTAADSSKTFAPKRNPFAQTGFLAVGDSSDEENESAPSSVSSAPLALQPPQAADLSSSQTTLILTKSAERCREAALIRKPRRNGLAKSH